MTEFAKKLEKNIISKGYTSNKYNFKTHYIQLFISGTLAAIGLGLDSNPLIISSLLTSPLFDSISHIILYFYTVKPFNFLARHSIYFTLDILILFVIGYIGGFLFEILKDRHNIKHLPEKKITVQMSYSTGYIPMITKTVICFLGGILILCMYLKKNANYYVGVSICISFVIPLVNSGMLSYYEDYTGSKHSFLIFLYGFISFFISVLFFSYNKCT